MRGGRHAFLVSLPQELVHALVKSKKAKQCLLAATLIQDGTDPQPPIHMGLRSNHSHQSFGSLGVAAAQDGQYDWSQPQNSWEGTAQAPHLGQMVSQGALDLDPSALLSSHSFLLSKTSYVETSTPIVIEPVI